LRGRWIFWMTSPRCARSISQRRRFLRAARTAGLPGRCWCRRLRPCRSSKGRFRLSWSLGKAAGCAVAPHWRLCRIAGPGGQFRRDLERRGQGPRPSRGQRVRRRLRHQVAQGGRQDHRRPRRAAGLLRLLSASSRYSMICAHVIPSQALNPAGDRVTCAVSRAERLYDSPVSAARSRACFLRALSCVSACPSGPVPRPRPTRRRRDARCKRGAACARVGDPCPRHPAGAAWARGAGSESGRRAAATHHRNRPHRDSVRRRGRQVHLSWKEMDFSQSRPTSANAS
jgi:hypothetical protein